MSSSKRIGGRFRRGRTSRRNLRSEAWRHGLHVFERRSWIKPSLRFMRRAYRERPESAKHLYTPWPCFFCDYRTGSTAG